MWHGSKLVRGTPEYWTGRTITILIVVAVFVAVIALYLLQSLPSREMRGWPVSAGTITEAHTIVRQYYNGERGSAVQFQPEIRVSYVAGGVQYTRWFALPGRWDLSREQLETSVQKLVGTQCQVHWRPRNPMDAYVTEKLISMPQKP